MLCQSTAYKVSDDFQGEWRSVGNEMGGAQRNSYSVILGQNTCTVVLTCALFGYQHGICPTPVFVRQQSPRIG